MWSPTHVQVTVQKARDLLTKGKNGTNDVFVTIALGKEKYQTSVKEKAIGAVEWHEECELQIPEHGNTAEIVLSALHRNFMGVDEFLGMANIPLADFDVYERPRNRWYTLKSKPGKEKTKPRGDLEVKVAFIVKAGSLTDLSKKEKHKSSLGQLSHMAHSVGGSLLSIGSADKRKSLKKIAKSIGNKVTRKDKKNQSLREESLESYNIPLERTPARGRSGQLPGEADPGVISEGESEDDEFTFDDLSHKSSASSLSTTQPPANTTNTLSPPSGGTLPSSNSLENLAGGEFLRRTSATPPTKPPAKPPRTTPAPEKAVDEWEEKLFGKQEKGGSGGDTLKRRSWESSRNILSNQSEIKETPEVVPEKNENSKSTIPSNPPEPENNKKTIKEIKIETDKNEDNHEKEKEKEHNKFSRKLKNLRRDAKFSELFPDTKPVVSSLINATTPYERIIIGGESETTNQRNSSTHVSHEVMQKFQNKSREELVELVCDLQGMVEHQQRRMKDMEDYLDNLLLRVMETTPRLLQNPSSG